MTENEMIALSYYHSSTYDPKQLDFMMQLGKPPVLDSGQYLLFGNQEKPKPQKCDGLA
uniref:Uncharacterized protein n=1 Tax=Candidatus Kentrum sp. SD TaxID=2126332 RepID=A0A450YLI5_9GAMM|nr:MAG: hypothetical protein BECKSD772F_GA0070984_11214 [Candidatus Kentron sp. SD]VFK48899.1 MAG: hypothetical protein BECKSD772E_GA0070983_11484 [Candidatus Kentron sp. SD]